MGILTIFLEKGGFVIDIAGSIGPRREIEMSTAHVGLLRITG